MTDLKRLSMRTKGGLIGYEVHRSDKIEEIHTWARREKIEQEKDRARQRGEQTT